MAIWTVLFVLCYLAASVFSYGMSFAALQRKFKCVAKENRPADMFFCGVFALVPWAAIPIVYATVGWHGLLFKPEEYTKEEMYPEFYSKDEG